MERKNRITYKIKTGYYLDLLTPGTNKLPGSTKIKVVKDENGKNAPDLLSVKSVRIRSYSGPYLIRMLKSTDQSNSEYGTFHALLEINEIQLHMRMIKKCLIKDIYL